MKKTIIFIAALCVFFVGCNKVDTPSDISSNVPPSSTQSSEVVSESKYDNSEVRKYYDYFLKDGGLSMLNFDGQPFSDAEISAYVICAAPEYSYEHGGIDVEIFDKYCERYFGKKVTEYDNQYVYLTEDDKVCSVGWGPTTLILLLDEKSVEGEVTTAKFSCFAYPIGEEIDVFEKKVFSGELEEYEPINTINMTFKELTDEKGEMYLQLLSADREQIGY